LVFLGFWSVVALEAALFLGLLASTFDLDDVSQTVHGVQVIAEWVTGFVPLFFSAVFFASRG
jgi:hypothetical protein